MNRKAQILTKPILNYKQKYFLEDNTKSHELYLQNKRLLTNFINIFMATVSVNVSKTWWETFCLRVISTWLKQRAALNRKSSWRHFQTFYFYLLFYFLKSKLEHLQHPWTLEQTFEILDIFSFELKLCTKYLLRLKNAKCGYFFLLGAFLSTQFISLWMVLSSKPRTFLSHNINLKLFWKFQDLIQILFHRFEELTRTIDTEH